MKGGFSIALCLVCVLFSGNESAHCHGVMLGPRNVLSRSRQKMMSRFEKFGKKKAHNFLVFFPFFFF